MLFIDVGLYIPVKARFPFSRREKSLNSKFRLLWNDQVGKIQKFRLREILSKTMEDGKLVKLKPSEDESSSFRQSSEPLSSS